MLKGKLALWAVCSFIVFLGIGFLGAYLLLPAGQGGNSIPLPGPSVTETASTPATATIRPTVTSLPRISTVTPTLLPGATAESTATRAPAKTIAAVVAPPFRVQTGSPRYLSAFTHPDSGCGWIGVAGQVFGDGARFGEMSILVTGEMDGKPYRQVGNTGPSSPYGPRGYEIFLTDHNPGAAQTLTIQLFDASGNAISDPKIIKLPSSCENNLLLVNFTPNNP